MKKKEKKIIIPKGFNPTAEDRRMLSCSMAIGDILEEEFPGQPKKQIHILCSTLTSRIVSKDDPGYALAYVIGSLTHMYQKAMDAIEEQEGEEDE